MVSYQKWTKVAYNVAERKGADITGLGTQENNQVLVSVIAEVWNERKDELDSATVAEARTIAEQEIEIK